MLHSAQVAPMSAPGSFGTHSLCTCEVGSSILRKIALVAVPTRRPLPVLDWARSAFLLRLVTSAMVTAPVERSQLRGVVGEKTEQSLRRVPLPACLSCPRPSRERCLQAATRTLRMQLQKKLNRFLDDCGIVEPRKGVHSLRHRAKTGSAPSSALNGYSGRC